MKTALAEGSHKRGIFPFLSENIIPGQKVLVKSSRHRRELMKRYGLHDARDVSMESQTKRRRWYAKEKKEEKKKTLEDIYLNIKRGQIDKRKMDLAIRKAEYERRNGRKV